VALQDTFTKFSIPLFPWQNLAWAMQQDVGKDSFPSFPQFLKYADGAAVAPATVFMFLLAAKKDSKGYHWNYSSTQIYHFARKLALFCYLTHVIRDVSQDLSLGRSGLLYLSEEELGKLGLSKKTLLEFRRQKKGNRQFEQLVAKYVKRARAFETAGRESVARLYPTLEKDSRFILTLLLEFYSATLDKIEKLGYNVFSGRQKLTLAEEKKLIRKVVGHHRARLRHV
jgi:phytoene synthase